MKEKKIKHRGYINKCKWAQPKEKKTEFNSVLCTRDLPKTK